MPAGRPTKYDPGFCEQVIELAREGMGRAEIAYELSVDRMTLSEWEKAHAEFSSAMSRAKDVAAGWWEKQGRAGIWSKDFNAQAYRLQVMNRFPADWRDKQEHQHSGHVSIEMDFGAGLHADDDG